MPYALIAPITRVPSRPRLMRPERSVMHSPRLTKRNGVETRMAPPNTARGTVQSPIVPSAMSAFPLQEAKSSIERVACENEHEDNSLQHLDRGVRQAEPALQQTAACADPAEQNGDGNNGKRVLPGQEGDEDAGEAVACGEVGVGAALHRGDFNHSGKAGGRPSQKADRHNQLADAEAHNLGCTNVAAGYPRGEAEHS